MNYSWIIPIGDAEAPQDISRCFNALQKILDPLDEVLVVRHHTDRGLVDSLISRLKCLITIVDHPETRTAAAARNAALQHCKYKKIIFQDVDDVPHSNRRKVIDNNLINPGMIVSTGYQTFFDGQKRGKRVPKSFSNWFYFRTNIFLPTTAIYLRQNENVYFDNLRLGEDTVFFSKLIFKGFDVKICNEITIDYNITSKKVYNKRGVIGVINEIKYRLALYKHTSSVVQKILVITGAIFFCFLKLIPKTLFRSLYKIGHSFE